MAAVSSSRNQAATVPKSPLKSPGKDAGPGYVSIDELLACSVCEEPVQQPKLLKCGHTVCGDPCLMVAFRTYSQQNGAKQGILPCPYCRKMVILPSGTVESLPEDFKIKKIRTMLQRITIHESMTGKKCDLCTLSGRTRVPDYFCTTCSKQYCRDCKKKHDQKALFKTHDVVAIYKEEALMYCKEHSNENVKYFCYDCNLAICTMCVLHKHTEHNTGELGECVRSRRDHLTQLFMEARGKVHHSRQKIKQIKIEGEVRDKAFRETEKAIRAKTEDTVKRAEDIIRKSKEREKLLLDQLFQSRQALTKGIGFEPAEGEMQLIQPQSVCDHVEVVLSKLHPIQIIAVFDDLAKQLEQIVKVDKIPEPDGNVTVVRFSANSEVQDVTLGMLQKCIINTNPTNDEEEEL